MVVMLTAMNLRGVRESGTFFAIPTYAFMIAILGMCAWGLVRFLPVTCRWPRAPSSTSSRRRATRPER